MVNRKSFLRQVTPLLISLAIMGGLSLMVRRFERETPRPFDRLIVETLPELPDLSGRSDALLQRLELAHANLEVGALQRDALVELGYLYHANGFSPQAESCYLGLESFETMNPLWPYLLGVLKADRRDKDEVARHFERVVSLDPQDFAAYLRLGDAYRDAGRFDEAVKAYESRLLGLPNDAWALASLGQVAVLRGDRESALGLLLSAKAADPGVGLVYDLLPELYLDKGDVAKSREVRLEGLEHQLGEGVPDGRLDFLREYCFDADRLIRYAREAQGRGDMSEAVSYLERAVSLDADDDAAMAALNEIVAKLVQDSSR